MLKYVGNPQSTGRAALGIAQSKRPFGAFPGISCSNGSLSSTRSNALIRYGTIAATFRALWLSLWNSYLRRRKSRILSRSTGFARTTSAINSSVGFGLSEVLHTSFGVDKRWLIYGRCLAVVLRAPASIQITSPHNWHARSGLLCSSSRCASESYGVRVSKNDDRVSVRVVSPDRGQSSGFEIIRVVDTAPQFRT